MGDLTDFNILQLYKSPRIPKREVSNNGDTSKWMVLILANSQMDDDWRFPPDWKPPNSPGSAYSQDAKGLHHNLCFRAIGFGDLKFRFLALARVKSGFDIPSDVYFKYIRAHTHIYIIRQCIFTRTIYIYIYTLNKIHIYLYIYTYISHYQSVIMDENSNPNGTTRGNFGT